MAETYGHQPGYAKSFEAVFGKVAHSPETGLIVLIFRDHEFLLYDPVKNAGLSRKRGKIRYVSVEKISMETIIFQVGTHQVTSLLKSRTGQSERSRRNSKTMDL